jgi:hypothetical protein
MASHFQNGKYVLSSFLNVDEFERPGEESLEKLCAHDVIYMDKVSIDGLDIHESIKAFFRNPQHRSECDDPNTITTINDNLGMIRFPNWDVSSRYSLGMYQPPPSSGRIIPEWDNDPILPVIECQNAWSGNCKKCVQYGKWGLSYGERKLWVPHRPTLVCLHGCQECIQENKFLWGVYRSPEVEGDIVECHDDMGESIMRDKRPWLPVPNNGSWRREHGYMGTYNFDFSTELTYYDIILKTLHDIWDVHPDSDPPHWSDFFETVPSKAIRMIFEIFGFRGTIDQVRHLPIDPLAEDKVNEVYSKLYGTGDIYSDEEELDESQSEETQSNRREHVSSALQIIEGIMDTEEQVLDQGKFLELCKLFKDIHQE